jgi:hypothetical protein
MTLLSEWILLSVFVRESSLIQLDVKICFGLIRQI